MDKEVKMRPGKGDETVQANTITGGRAKAHSHFSLEQYISIHDQDGHFPHFKEKVHLWTTIRVIHIFTQCVSIAT